MITPNLIVEIHAPPKTGKSHLMCTFPDPIVVFSFDLGMEPVLPKFKGKDIRVMEYPVPIQMTSKPEAYAKPIWQAFVKDYLTVLDDSKVKTVCVDTGTALYEIARVARSEELGRSIVPYEYAEVYARITGLMLKTRHSGKNFVMTHWMRDEYINDKKTGALEIDGYRRVVDYSDVSLGLERKRKGNKNVFVTTIVDSKYENPDITLTGQTIENATYNDIMALLMEGYDE